MTEGPGYWDVNENSAGHVHQSRHGGHWRETIRRESPAGAMQRLVERSAELSREASERARRIADQLAETDTPELRATLFERAEYLADLYERGHTGLHGEELAAERLAWLLTERRDADDALAELRAGRHAELLTELWVEDLTALLTDYRAQLREQAERRAAWAADLLGRIDAVAKEDP